MKTNILDILFQTCTSPVDTLSELTNRKPLGLAVLTAVFTSIVFSLTALPNPPELVETIFHLDKRSFNFMLALGIFVILYVVLIFIGGVLFHITAKLLHGTGDYSGIVCGLSFACFPLAFLAPLAFLRALLESSGNTLYFMVSTILFIWTLLLIIIAISVNYRISFWRAIAAFFIPVGLFVITPLFIITIYGLL